MGEEEKANGSCLTHFPLEAASFNTGHSRSICSSVVPLPCDAGVRKLLVDTNQITHPSFMSTQGKHCYPRF